MSLSAVDGGGTDCLLECLREVRLQQFAGNFATRGVTNCSRLAALDRQQFATYGITSPSDIRRLTRLITVIKDLRADGVLCRHGAESKSAGEKPDSTRRTSDLWQTVERCQKKQFAGRRSVGDTANNSSMLRDAAQTRPKTAPQRRPTRDTARPRRAARRSSPTPGGQLSRHSVGVETQYDGPTSFTPICQRTVSHLPTHVQKVRLAQSLLEKRQNSF